MCNIRDGNVPHLPKWKALGMAKHVVNISLSLMHNTSTSFHNAAVGVFTGYLEYAKVFQPQMVCREHHQ